VWSLKSCGSVIVDCNYGVLKSCASVNVVCEYNGSVVDVYGDELKEGECGCRKELWVERRREEV
jgi:hypothetical protein